MISSGLTGRFPFTSGRGMTYLFVLYDYDSNAILANPIKSRKAEDIAAGYEFCYQQLTVAGIRPIIQRLDNEASNDLIKAITDKNLQYQLASPHDHRLNPAKRTIQTLKKTPCCLPQWHRHPIPISPLVSPHPPSSYDPQHDTHLTHQPQTSRLHPTFWQFRLQ
jgi:hypothetical protein